MGDNSLPVSRVGHIILWEVNDSTTPLVENTVLHGVVTLPNGSVP